MGEFLYSTVMDRILIVGERRPRFQRNRRAIRRIRAPHPKGWRENLFQTDFSAPGHHFHFVFQFCDIKFIKPDLIELPGS